MKKKIVMISAAAVAAVSLILGGTIWFVHSHKGNDKNENVVYVNTIDSIMNPGMGNGRMNRFAGVVETQKQMDVQPNQERTIKKIQVEEGQEVSEGTVLFTYDTEKETDSLTKTELELERIKNTIENKKDEIKALEKEKKKAGSDAQLDYTMQIQSAQMELKQSEYEQKTKEVEIEKLEDAIENAEVKSQMNGVIKSINNGEQAMNNGEQSSAFMTIIAMGDYRIKGKVNEQNMSSIMPGQPVLIHSRTDENLVWKGTMGDVDTEKPQNENANYYGGDPSTQSSSYPFYVQLDSSEGLMLGQHVYIEMDYGQEEKRVGVWLDESFIVQEEGKAYVWAENKKGKLEKREVVLGQHDEEMFLYEIADGLTEEDKITFPEEGLKEGMKTALGEEHQMGMSSSLEMDVPDDMINQDTPEIDGESMNEGEDESGMLEEKDKMEAEMGDE